VAREKILVVEDVPDNMIFFIESLRPTGHTIYQAVDGRQAVDLAREEQPDLILLDIHLPVLNGYEAAKLIRESCGGAVIIALTARAMKGDREKILESGFDDYLSKPVHPDELIAKVDEWMAKRCS